MLRLSDWAVHPGAKFREPGYREDRNLHVDWHFATFRRENAVGATISTIAMIDSLVSLLDRGSDELKTMKQHARGRMDEILARCEAITAFPPIIRDVPTRPTEPTADAGD